MSPRPASAANISDQRPSIVSRLTSNTRPTLSLMAKDIRVSLADRAFTFTSIIIPVNYLFLFMIVAASGAKAPVAVVMNRDGVVSRQVLQAVTNSRSFVIHVLPAAKAERRLHEGSVVAVITLPTSLDTDVPAGRPVALPVQVNNLNVDYTDDIRRALPLSIVTYTALHHPEKLPLSSTEHDLHATEPSYARYVAVSSVVIAVAIGGMLAAGTLAAREHEEGTLKILLPSPCRRGVQQAAHVAAGMVLGLIPTGLGSRSPFYYYGFVWPISVS